MINYRGLSIPYVALGLGGITSDHLFGPNEQTIFDFYEANRHRYRRALDIGANIGVHSILMARQGWEVQAYEPDPWHFDLLLENIRAHQAPGGAPLAVSAHLMAVSDQTGTATFVRVLNNTTGSHLAGAKDSYGPTAQFEVRQVSCRGLFAWADFAKIDCEGHEAVLVRAVPSMTWRRLDAMLEVGTAENARLIYDHLRDDVPMWAQKTGWGRVATLGDMPVCHQEGSLFIGTLPPFPEDAGPGVAR